jgi:hypothetical protein
VQYHHAAAEFPTKPSWLKAIKNKQYPSWPGLTWEATNKHFPESKETSKGHRCKTRSGLQSMKTSATRDSNNNETNETTHPPCPHSKQKEAIMQTFDLNDEAKHLVYTNQTGRFPAAATNIS